MSKGPCKHKSLLHNMSVLIRDGQEVFYLLCGDCGETFYAEAEPDDDWRDKTVISMRKDEMREVFNAMMASGNE